MWRRDRHGRTRSSGPYLGLLQLREVPALVGGRLPPWHPQPTHRPPPHRFRPTYPPTVYEAILARHGSAPRDLAVDVGTGSGQVAADLAAHFKAVVGVDPSEQQLGQARQAANVTYRQGTAEATGLPPGSADLVTAATALHWWVLLWVCAVEHWLASMHAQQGRWHGAEALEASPRV